MSRSERIRRLEAAAPSNIPDCDVGHYCPECLGAGGYRRMIDYTRACMERGVERHYSDRCRRCGQATYDGAVRDVRRKLGLDA
jgi:hypothetical protein